MVNPGPGEEPQTIVVPEQAETVYVIGKSDEQSNPAGDNLVTIAASRDGAETIVPEQNPVLENILKVVAVLRIF